MNTKKTSDADRLRYKIASLKKKVRQIEAQEARQKKSEAKRAHQRRVYMVGEIYVHCAEEDPVFLSKLTPLIDRAYTSDKDRALWGLPPLPAGKNGENGGTTDA